MLHLHKTKVYFCLNKKYSGFDMAKVCYFGGFFFFKTWASFAEQGNKGKALPCASFSSQHQMVFELLNHWITSSECNSKIYIYDVISDSEESGPYRWQSELAENTWLELNGCWHFSGKVFLSASKEFNVASCNKGIINGKYSLVQKANESWILLHLAQMRDHWKTAE